MQFVMMGRMLTITPFHKDTIHQLAPAYAQFYEQATTDYGWELAPVDFETLVQLFKQGIFSGYMIGDTLQSTPYGFLIYRLEEHRSIELHTLYLPDEAPKKVVLDNLFPRLIQDNLKNPGWDVISYAMLGKQAEWVRSITWYGFKPVGQAILRFSLTDPIHMQILSKQQMPPLPEGFTLTDWEPQYAGGAAETIFEAFSPAADALWDPRFRTLNGCRRVIAMLSAGGMGTFIPECTTLVHYEGQVVGVCFLVETDVTKANIPLVGVRKEIQGKKLRGYKQGLGLGQHVLHNTLMKTMHLVLEGKYNLFDLSATMETENYPALKMYRRFGFMETAHYPHVHLSRENAEKLVRGRWYQTNYPYKDTAGTTLDHTGNCCSA